MSSKRAVFGFLMGSLSYRAGFCTSLGEIKLLLHTTPITVQCIPSSHPSHPVPFEAAEAGADQRLPADGGGVHSQPGADEAPGGETGGQTLINMLFLSLCRGLNVAHSPTHIS